MASENPLGDSLTDTMPQTPYRPGEQQPLDDSQETESPHIPSATYCMRVHRPRPFSHDRYDPFNRYEFESNKPKRERWHTPITSTIHKIIPYGGFVSNVFILCSITLGGGIIGMPQAFKTSGIAMAIIYLIVVNTLTIYSFAVLGLMIRRTGVRTYEEAGELLFGRWGGHFVGLVLAATYLGVIISYIPSISSLLSPILLKSSGTPRFLTTKAGISLLVTLIWMVVLVPMIIPKYLNSIRYIFIIGVTMVLLFVLTTFIHSCTTGLQYRTDDEIVYFATGNQAIQGLSIFVFAFMNQGPVFSIATEMSPRFSVKQLSIVAAVSCTICTIFYIMVGVFGYLDFGEDVQSSILYNFDPVHQPYMMISYIGMLVKICGSFAVNIVPVRNYLYYSLRWNLKTSPYRKHAILVVGISIVALITGLLLPSVTIVFGLVGSLFGGFVNFIFPAFLWMYSGNWTLKKVGIWHYLGCHALIIVGVIALVWGFIATLYFDIAD